jgi:hypothetical protein
MDEGDGKALTLEEAIAQARELAKTDTDGIAYLIYSVTDCTWQAQSGRILSDEPVLYVSQSFPGEVFPYWDDNPHGKQKEEEV